MLEKFRKKTSTEEGNPQSEVVDHIRSIVRNGEVNASDSRHAALHGTSIEGICHILDHGILPGQTRPKSWGFKPGDVFIWPAVVFIPGAQVLNSSTLDQLPQPVKIKVAAIGSAQRNARVHSFLSILGLPLSDESNWESSDKLTDYDNLRKVLGRERPLNHYVFQLEKKGIPKENIIFASQQARKKQGFVLGISSEIQTQKGVKIMRGVKEDGDVRIRTNGKGLDFHFISGIEPLGVVEKQFLGKFLKRT